MIFSSEWVKEGKISEKGRLTEEIRPDEFLDPAPIPVGRGDGMDGSIQPRNRPRSYFSGSVPSLRIFR